VVWGRRLGSGGGSAAKYREGWLGKIEESGGATR
jgi:hypothetical protein